MFIADFQFLNLIYYFVIPYSLFIVLLSSLPLSFSDSDLRKFKEAKKQFDKVSEEKEAALIKNAQAPRNKQHEVEEATNILTATRKCFRHIVLDYVLQVRFYKFNL